MRLFSRHVDDDYSAYLDSRMSETERTRFDLHLMDCAQCRKGFEETRQAVLSLRTLQSVDVPRTFVLNEAMLGAPLPARSASRWQPIAAPAAGLAVLTVLLVGGDLATSTDDTEEPAELAVEEELAIEQTEEDAAAGAESAPAEDLEADDDTAERATEQTEAGAAAAEVGGEDGAAEEPGADDDDDGAAPEIAPSDEDAVESEESGAPAAAGDEATPFAAEPEATVESTTPPSEEQPPPTGEPTDELAADEDDDDGLRLLVRILAGVSAAAAFTLGAIAFKRWRAQR
jgi:Putative zinc-finger